MLILLTSSLCRPGRFMDHGWRRARQSGSGVLCKTFLFFFNQAVPEIQDAQSLSALQGNAHGATSQQRQARSVYERTAGPDESQDVESSRRLAEIVGLSGVIVGRYVTLKALLERAHYIFAYRSSCFQNTSFSAIPARGCRTPICVVGIVSSLKSRRDTDRFLLAEFTLRPRPS